MTGIRGWSILALAMSAVMVMAGCSAGGRVDDEDDDDDGATGTIGGDEDGAEAGGEAPGAGTLLILGTLGLATVWTARRLRR